MEIDLDPAVFAGLQEIFAVCVLEIHGQASRTFFCAHLWVLGVVKMDVKTLS